MKVKNWQVSLLFAYWKIKFPNLLNYKIRVSFDFTFIFFIKKKTKRINVMYWTSECDVPSCREVVSGNP